MIVEWVQSRVKIIPLIDEVGKRIEGSMDVIKLLPGFNEVPNEIWTKLKPALKTEYDNQFIKEVVEKVEKVEEVKKDGKVTTKKVEKETSEFNEFTNTKARKSIKECYSVETLEKWRDAEGRADIRNLIDKRIDDILEGKDDESIEVNKN